MQPQNRKIYQGDTLQTLKTFRDNSIDIIITSPPYFALRDYGIKGQLGKEKDYRDFLKYMKNFMNECKRILKPTGTIWINLGDTYASGTSHYDFGKTSTETSKKFYNDESLEKLQFKANKKDQFEAKTLMGIPQRFYIDCIDSGWIARNYIPWIKNNAMPSSEKDRFTNKWESIFFFAKTSKINFYYHEITEEAADNLPKIPKINKDYVLVKCLNKSPDKKNANIPNSEKRPCRSKSCTLCKGTGKKKKSFWHSVNYYFNLDPVRKKLKTDQFSKKPKMLSQTKDNTIQYDLSGYIAADNETEDNQKNPYQQHNSRRRRRSRKAGTWNEATGSENKQDNVIAADGKVKKTYEGFNERYKKAQQRKHAQISYPNNNPQTIAKNCSGNFDIETGKCVNHQAGKNPGDVFDFIKNELFLSEKYQLHYDADGFCLGCGLSWRKHTAAERAKGSINEETKRTENIVWCNPKGKNPGNTFNINTKPYKEAHFATFPIELPLEILKCAAPSTVCPKCTKPRIPITKTEYHKITESKSRADEENQKGKNRIGLVSRNGKGHSTHHITGYSRCNCRKKFKPGIVLDPFFGAGTTGVAAEMLGLQWCGIELNPQYIETAEKRLNKFRNDKLQI